MPQSPNVIRGARESFTNALLEQLGLLFVSQGADITAPSGAAVIYYRSDTTKFRTIDDTGIADNLATEGFVGAGGGAGLAHLGGAETFTGAKTFNVGNLKINNAGGTFATTMASAATAARTWTLPDATDTGVGLAATQELTNKTLTAMVVKNGLTASGSAINDFSGSTADFKASTGAFTWAGASGKAGAIGTTAAGLTLSTTTSGTLAVSSAGALTMSGAAASSLQITAANLTVSTVTSGTMAVDSAAALQLGATNATSIAIGNGAISTTVTGTLALGTTWSAASSNGVVSKYNNESTVGVGQPYIVAAGQDVASSGAGAQTTAVATKASPTSGLYRVDMVISAHTNTDTVSMQVTYTDAVESFATTLTPISSVALTHDANSGTTSASVFIRASAATSIVCQISLSSQATTKASAVITRLN